MRKVLGGGVPLPVLSALIANDSNDSNARVAEQIDGLDVKVLEVRVRYALLLQRFWATTSCSGTGKGESKRNLKGTGTGPRTALTFQASESNPVTDVFFVFSKKGNNSIGGSDFHDWLLTVSKGIWSTVVCWDVSMLRPSAWMCGNIESTAGSCGGSCGSEGRGQMPTKLGEWSDRSALIRDVVVNTDSTSEGCLTLSIAQEG